MADYKFYKDARNVDNAGVIYKTEEMTKARWIPIDLENADYIKYIEWAKSNTTDPAD